MLGDDLRLWFELFHGIAVYRPQSGGGYSSDGWLNWSDIENRFKSENLTFEGKKYEPEDAQQQNQLLDALVNYASAFVTLRLLERRRQLVPPSLDYRVTPLGMRVGNWGYGVKPGFRKRAFFFTAAALFRVYKFRAIITIGVVGWGILNAVRFYTTALDWATHLPFASSSAAAIAFVGAVLAIIKSKLR